MPEEPMPESPQSSPAEPPSKLPGQKSKKGGLKGCLIVICILILAGVMGLPYPNVGLMIHTKELPAKAAMKGLEIAIKGFKTEYLRLPYVGATLPKEDNSAFDTTEPEGRALLDVLLDTSSTDQNARHIHFWEPPNMKSNGAGYTASDGLKDPWGQRGYRILLDYSGDGKITNPAKVSRVDGEPEEITSDVIIYSAGPDGDFATWKDNVCSWR